jgi:hypothetical protein
MAIIYTYPTKSNPVDGDLVLISDTEDGNKTKQVSIANIRGATTSGVSSIIAGTSNVTLPTGQTGDVTISVSSSLPGGADTEIQYNNGGSFGGTTGLEWDNSTNILSIATRYEGDIDGAVIQQVIANEALSKGDVVYISGGAGDNPEVRKAQANSVSTMAALGIMKDNTNLNDIGECVTSGEITGLNLTGFTTGDELFVSNTTAGGLLTSAPTGEANLIQKIGKVIKGGAGGALTVLGAFRTNATPNLNEGSLFIGNASNQASTLPIGASTYVLESDGTTARWGTTVGIATQPSTGTARLEVGGLVRSNAGTLAEPAYSFTGNTSTGMLNPASGNELAFSVSGGSVLSMRPARIDSLQLHVFDATAGIRFGGTGTTLNSYEEGTWTPTAAQFTGTPPTTASSSGTYTRIGNIVHVTFNLVVTGSSSVGAGAWISGLPFTADGSVGSRAAGSFFNNTDANTAANYPSTIRVNGNNLELLLENSAKLSTTAPLGLEIDASATWFRPSGS